MAKKEIKTNNSKENNKENNKNKKSFFKSFKAELKKVVWPTPKQLVNNTIAVITIVLITAAIVFLLDLTFEAINKNGIDKIKEVINPTNSVSDNNTTSENTDNPSEENENTSSDENTNTSTEENVNTDKTNENPESNESVTE